MPNTSAERPRRITTSRDGPLLLEGPVEVVLEDGTTVSSERFCVALCTCRRSRTYPWCDTSHRKSHRKRPKPDRPDARDPDRSGSATTA
ncbi:CDGSH iron-sulfur domain-containing protein [Streptomyces sp. NPDC050704]|uniref:CDGSH iron-sulfur domain-containing protein n=1 Tax=Streptomyces sp. NPDC050704 TaxID=3157219 RepID=UPI0034266265